MNLKALAARIFGPLVDKTGDVFFITKESLPRADIKITFRTYMSMAFFAAALVLVASFVMILMITSVIAIPLFLKLAMFAFIPLLNAIVTVFVVAFYPYQKMASRRKSIEMNLPFVLTHMGAIAASGVPPYVIFRLIAEFKEYGEVAAEMKKVIRNIEMFGLNPLAAVREVAARTPSDKFKQVMLGFITTTESGGDVKLFLKSAGTQALFEWRIKREKFLQQLSAYAEFYTGIMIAAPLFIISLFAVMNMIQSTVAGYDIMFLTKLSIYVVVPVMNVAFLLLLQGTEVEM